MAFEACYSLTCSERCRRTLTEKISCGIARFPCDSRAFLSIKVLAIWLHFCWFWLHLYFACAETPISDFLATIFWQSCWIQRHRFPIAVGNFGTTTNLSDFVIFIQLQWITHSINVSEHPVLTSTANNSSTTEVLKHWYDKLSRVDYDHTINYTNCERLSLGPCKIWSLR